jgi:hypothetical protein
MGPVEIQDSFVWRGDQTMAATKKGAKKAVKKAPAKKKVVKKATKKAAVKKPVAKKTTKKLSTLTA